VAGLDLAFRVGRKVYFYTVFLSVVVFLLTPNYHVVEQIRIRVVLISNKLMPSYQRAHEEKN
jgi:uncharacterized protein YqhQ